MLFNCVIMKIKSKLQKILHIYQNRSAVFFCQYIVIVYIYLQLFSICNQPGLRFTKKQIL